jgi:hypothetical protein
MIDATFLANGPGSVITVTVLMSKGHTSTSDTFVVKTKNDSSQVFKAKNTVLQV